RHQIIVQGARPLFKFLYVSTSMKFSSGLRYTPIVAGDVNGDGWLNDRAFIFNPSLAGTDTAVAHGLRGLLADGSRSARECLTSQIGTLAGRNSCVGPW